jgi:hypothetical protein
MLNTCESIQFVLSLYHMRLNACLYDISPKPEEKVPGQEHKRPVLMLLSANVECHVF